jgi:hypothetical protein
MDPLGQLLGCQGEAHGVATWISNLVQSIEKSKRLKYCRIDANTDSWVTFFDPLEGWAAGESAVGYDSCGKAAAPPSVAEVMSELAKASVNGNRGSVGCRHVCNLRMP